MDIETVNSAIRHATTEALCLIHTNFGRWLIVEGYPQERTEALSKVTIANPEQPLQLAYAAGLRPLELLAMAHAP